MLMLAGLAFRPKGATQWPSGLCALPFLVIASQRGRGNGLRSTTRWADPQGSREVRRRRAHYEMALALLREADAVRDGEAAALYHNLGGIEHARRRYDAAEPFAREVVRLRFEAFGDDYPKVAADRVALAAILEAPADMPSAPSSTRTHHSGASAGTGTPEGRGAQR